jgi:hypothetical protein
MIQLNEEQYQALLRQAKANKDGAADERAAICNWILRHRSIWGQNAVDCILRGEHLNAIPENR